MSEPDKAWLSTNQVAEVLGVTPGRVRQLHGDGVLPPPIDLGARVGAWYWSDIRAIKAQREGRCTSPLASMLNPPDQALTRIRDEVVEIEAMTGHRPVHLRVWQGEAAEGERTVVLLGSLDGSVDVSSYLDMSLQAVIGILHIPLESITWFLYRPRVEHSRIHSQTVQHLIVGESGRNDDDEPAGLRRWFRPVRLRERNRWIPPMRWYRPSTLAEVEQLVGAPVEAYPGSAYRAEVIESWQRRRRTIEVTRDEIYFEQLMRSIAHLQWETAKEQGHPDRLADLQSAMWLMADEVRTRLDYVRRGFDDGTQPRERPDQPGAYWPDTWAARLVLPRPDHDEQVLLDQFPSHFAIPKDPADHGKLRGLLARLRSWAESVDPYSGRHDPPLFSALSTANNLLAFYLSTYDEDFRENDHPDTTPVRLDVAGKHDRAYLQSVNWLRGPAKQERSYRRLHAELGLKELDRLRYGLDGRGKLVIHDPGKDPDSPWSENYSTEWPLRPGEEGIPAGSMIVADAGDGDRPAYILDPSGRITPLPKIPDRIHAQWNFGYSGGGPGALAAAIVSAIRRADHLGEEPFEEPTWARWVDNQVCFGAGERPQNAYDPASRKEMTELRLAVDEIREQRTRP